MLGWLDKLRGMGGRLTDAQALERYRYLVRTAPMETLEQAHRDAFIGLRPERRALAVKQLNAQLGPSDRVPPSASTDPNAFARAATRCELKHPGAVERALVEGDLLQAIVAGFISTATAGDLLGLYGETDPVEADAVAAADPARDGAFGDDADYEDDVTSDVFDSPAMLEEL